MIKWAALIAVLITTVVGGLKIYNHYQPSGRNNLLKRAVPRDAAFFIEVQNMKKLARNLEKYSYSNELSRLPLFQKLSEYISVLNPLCEKNSDWRNALYSNTFISSYHFIGDNKFDIVLLLDFSNHGEPDFEKQLTKIKAQTASRNFRGEKIYEVEFTDRKKLNIAFVNDVCIISSTASLTEDAMAQMMGRNNLIEEKSFSDLLKPLPEKFDVTLYINYKNLGDFISGYSIPEATDYLNSFSSFADWSAFDLKFEKNEIGIHGYTTTDQKSKWLYQFDATTTLNNLTSNFIPDNAAMVMSSSLGTNSAFNKTNSSLQSDPDFRMYIKPWIGKEVDFVLTEPVNENFAPQSFLVFNDIDAKRTSEVLLQYANVKSGGDSSIFFQYKSISIFQLKVGDVFKKYFPNSLVAVSNPFCCVYGNSVIMSNSLGQMKMYIDKLNDKSTISESVFQKSGFKNSQYSFWLNPARLKDFVRALASYDFKKSYSSYNETIRKCNSIILPFTLKENFYETIGAISFSEIKKPAEGYAWKTELDAVAIISPQAMNDADGNKIVFIQDAFNQLYCINKVGDIVWKRKLDSPVMGTIYQLDLYSNSQQQYVLNTSGGIYLFDINGKDINNFPIRLAATATAPLSMIDFDGRQQFKYFITCSNGCIYGFEKSGRPLEGWNPNAANGSVKNPIQFFKAGKTEFLIVADETGKLLFFDRNGRKASKEYKTSLSITAPLMLSKKNQVLAIDNPGKIYALGLDGKSKLYNIIPEESQFAIMNMGKDTSVEANLLIKNKLMRIATDSAQLFTYFFANGNPSALKILNWDNTNENLALAIDETNQLLYLINDEGKLLNGFPKKGSSQTSLTDLYGNNEGVLLTVINGNELIAYPIDVTVQ